MRATLCYAGRPEQGFALLEVDRLVDLLRYDMLPSKHHALGTAQEYENIANAAMKAFRRLRDIDAVCCVQRRSSKGYSGKYAAGGPVLDHSVNMAPSMCSLHHRCTHLLVVTSITS